jgi:hypothetical protein
VVDDKNYVVPAYYLVAGSTAAFVILAGALKTGYAGNPTGKYHDSKICDSKSYRTGPGLCAR